MKALPRGWAWTTLGEIGEYLNGRGFRKHEWSDRGRPIVRIQNLTGSGASFNYFDGDADESYIARSGDLLISWAATLGAFIWDGPEAVVNQHIFKVRSFIDTRFHRYLVASVLDELQRTAHGSGMVHVTRKVFDETPVPLPPLAEQRRIVGAIEEQISRIEAAASGLRHAEDRLGHLRAAVLAAATEGWPERLLGSFSRMFVGTTPSRRSPSLWEGDVPWVSSGEVRFARISKTRESISRTAITHADRIHPPGTVLLAMIGEGRTRGQAAILDVAAAHNQNSAAIRLDETVCVPEWLFYVLMARYDVTRRAGSGAQQPALNRTRVAVLSVPLPPIDKQRDLVAEIEVSLESIAHLRLGLSSAARRTDALRRSILATAFRGELVPQDPDDEPASVLLERIAAERAAAPPARRTRRRVPAET